MIEKKIRTLLLLIFLLEGSLLFGADLTRIGGGLSFSTGIENEDHKTGNPGIHARGVIEFGEKIWLVPGLTFYLPGKRQGSTTLFTTLDADAVIRLGSEKTILFYGLAGANLSYLRTKYDLSPKETKLTPALNVGTGIEMIVEKDWTAFAQLKGVIGSYKQYIVIGIGVHYYISGRRYRTW
jgi:hypothetical protein